MDIKNILILVIFGFVAAILIIFYIIRRGATSVEEINNITPSEVDKLIRENKNDRNLIILDVRTPLEFASGRIAGAINLDYHSPAFATSLDTFTRSKTYIVYCRSGNRSLKASRIMKDKGFNTIYNMEGGIMAWKDASFPCQDSNGNGKKKDSTAN